MINYFTIMFAIIIINIGKWKDNIFVLEKRYVFHNQ